jgi:hypothetical protein
VVIKFYSSGAKRIVGDEVLDVCLVSGRKIIDMPKQSWTISVIKGHGLVKAWIKP